MEFGGCDDGDDDGVEKEEEVRRLEAEEEEGPEEREVCGCDRKRHFHSQGREHEGEPEQQNFQRTHIWKVLNERDESEVCRNGNQFIDMGRTVGPHSSFNLSPSIHYASIPSSTIF